MEIKNCAALVTGGASGMGATTARALAAAGAKVAVLDRDLTKAQAVADEIGGIAFECDVSDAAAAEAVVAAAQEAHGVARVLVNCAGVGVAGRVVGREGPMPLADFSRVININLIGTFNLIRLAATAMAAAEPLDADGARGVIVNTASVAAYEGQVGQSAYSASKGGIVSMTLPIARELAQFGVRVLTIAPGLIKTPMMAGLPEEIQESLGASVPFPKRLGRPEEFSDTVMHIIASDYLNGEVIRLDGAIRLAPR